MPVTRRSPQAGPAARRWRGRLLRDALTRYGVALGGAGVIAALALIFLYLLYVVAPLFEPPALEPLSEYPPPGAPGGGAVHLALEEQREIGARFLGDGRIALFRAADGAPVGEERIAVPPGGRITAFAAGNAEQGWFAYGLGDGRAVVARLSYAVSYPGDRRVITPRIEYPLGRAPLVIDRAGRPLARLALQGGAEAATVAAAAGDGRLVLATFERRESFSGAEAGWEYGYFEIKAPGAAPDQLLLDQGQRLLYSLRRSGTLTVYEVGGAHDEPVVAQRINTLAGETRLTAAAFLAGDVSLLIGDSEGRISQWFAVRDANDNVELRKIREFRARLREIRRIVAEQRGKGFVAADAAGRIALFHATTGRTLASARPAREGLRGLALAPRGDGFLAEDPEGRMQFWSVASGYPEVSWSALWRPVWYESYPRPDYVWQSSAASSDFEPKFSLVPLAFGTLKAAFYAMLFAVPLSIMGAIYTAYFMAPRMRRLVKPGIEIMEALPTVILGFLAGLWLAPLIEARLSGIFAVLLIVPCGVLLFAYLWRSLPGALRHRVPPGWDAALLAPVIAALAGGALALGPLLDQALFGGDLRAWLDRELGVDFDQRNALVVGLAMGFAVIPTIFSLAEDAIFSVPRHLRYGSLALGATEWQTLVRVVLLTASPGIFAAVMIGLGRAVGETMIVLMATGNTPVMDLSIFQGMRTLSANIAVEMPESEVGSAHYRVLFLAALVLFAFTLVFNTAGELVRQRLRRRYGSL